MGGQGESARFVDVDLWRDCLCKDRGFLGTRLLDPPAGQTCKLTFDHHLLAAAPNQPTKWSHKLACLLASTRITASLSCSSPMMR